MDNNNQNDPLEDPKDQTEKLKMQKDSLANEIFEKILKNNPHITSPINGGKYPWDMEKFKNQALAGIEENASYYLRGGMPREQILERNIFPKELIDSLIDSFATNETIAEISKLDNIQKEIENKKILNGEEADHAPFKKALDEAATKILEIMRKFPFVFPGIKNTFKSFESDPNQESAAPVVDKLRKEVALKRQEYRLAETIFDRMLENNPNISSLINKESDPAATDEEFELTSVNLIKKITDFHLKSGMPESQILQEDIFSPEGLGKHLVYNFEKDKMQNKTSIDEIQLFLEKENDHKTKVIFDRMLENNPNIFSRINKGSDPDTEKKFKRDSLKLISDVVTFHSNSWGSKWSNGGGKNVAEKSIFSPDKLSEQLVNNFNKNAPRDEASKLDSIPTEKKENLNSGQTSPDKGLPDKGLPYNTPPNNANPDGASVANAQNEALKARILALRETAAKAAAAAENSRTRKPIFK